MTAGVVAVEPALAMISQRPAGAAPAIRGVAETLPIADRAVDSAMAVMTAHHWDDVTVGIDELVRVTRKTFVLVTLDVEAFANHWMVTDYAPEIFELHAALFPPMNLLTERIPCVQVTPWDVPCDCTDWFMAALWSRPELYLRPGPCPGAWCNDDHHVSFSCVV